MIKFFGRGSGFSDNHNTAFFYYKKSLVLMDCSMMAFIKMKNYGLESVADDQEVERIVVAVTHTHSDHVAGIPMLIHYARFVWHVKIVVVAPGEMVRDNLRYYLNELEGCSPDVYDLITAEDYKLKYAKTHPGTSWLDAVIPTEHVPELKGKCYGYSLFVGDKHVVYTGDTNSLDPFLPYIKEGTYLYTECSAFESTVHLHVQRLLDYVNQLKEKNVTVFLMHLDDEEKIREAVRGTGFNLAPLASFKGNEKMNKETTLKDIYDISAKLYAEMCSDKEKDHGAIFEYMTELGRTMADADRASFWKWDKHKKELWTTSATGVDKIVIPDDTGLVGRALKTGKIVVTNDPYSDPDFNKDVDWMTGYTTKSVLVMPVADINGQFIGAFQIINKNGDGGFDEEEDVRKLSMAALICGLAVESESFYEESHHDKLTKLKNRMGFYSDFSRIYNKVIDEDRKLSLFICDIDKFKRVNDTYGHNAGDDVLAFVASILEDSCGDKEAVYRWGGEEFIMMMPDTDLEKSVAKAEKIRERIQNSEINADGNTISVTMSFGCRQYDPELSIEENISKADEHLYTAKESGRNCVIH